jgi:hypothetical protein
LEDFIIDCPSGLRIRASKLKVRQFKLLGNRKALETGETFEQFLAACAKDIVDPGPAYKDAWSAGTVFDWKKALQGDRFCALLGIRRATHPQPFDFDVRCQGCGKEIGWTVDLSKLPVVRYPKSSIDSFVAKRDLIVEVDKRQVAFRLMTGAEEERIRNHLDRLEKSDKRTRQHAFDPLVDGALARLVSVTPAPKDLRDWYEDLDADEMLKIGRALEATAGGVETTLEIVHSDDPRCGATTRVELPFGSKDFWIPRGPGLGSATGSGSDES